MLTSKVADQLSVAKLGHVSIVIPVYNQERTISKALSRIRTVLDEAVSEYEVVVVDDGSADNTYEVLKKEAQSHPETKIISYKPNRGKGFAVRTGVLQSKGSVVLFTDGDLDITPDSIKEYIAQLVNYDLVIASKRHPKSRVNAPRSRIFLSRAFNLLTRLLVGIKIKDTQAGMKAGNGEIIRRIFSIMLVKRYAFDVELLLIATLLGSVIKEMPIEIDLQRRFKLRDIWRMFIDILAIAYRHRFRHWYGKRIKELINIGSR